MSVNSSQEESAEESPLSKVLDRCLEIHQMPGNLDNVSTVQQRIASLAQRSPEFAFTSLAHFMTLEWLESAYHKTRKDGAAGIDDVTGQQYAENLHDNLQNLLDRLKSGTYKAPPVKRKHIPKGTSGETRPISKRFEKYGLTVHPDKTKLIDFRAPNHYERRREEKSHDNWESGKRPETFDLLGFTHYWGKTRKGNWAVQRKTMQSRLARSVQRIGQWCRENLTSRFDGNGKRYVPK